MSGLYGFLMRVTPAHSAIWHWAWNRWDEAVGCGCWRYARCGCGEEG